MSLKTVGTALTRTLWTTGTRTPPRVQSPKVSRLSSACSGSAGGAQPGNKELSCGSDSDRPGADVQSSAEPPHRAASADKKRPKEPAGAPGGAGVRRRSFTSRAAPADTRSYLWARYNDTKRLVHGKDTVLLLYVLTSYRNSQSVSSASTRPHGSEDILFVLFQSLVLCQTLFRINFK